MLVNLNEILSYAVKNNCAIGAFNSPNLESLNAAIKASEKYGVPVIINHAEVHDYIIPLEVIGPVMLTVAKNASVPVCVHLDHGVSVDFIKKALEIGFTSVMYDGSALSYEENAENTKKVVEMAKKYNAGVEGEIGVMSGHESGMVNSVAVESLYTDPELAKRFVSDTGIDALAASFGTAHGIYKETPKLDFERIEKIREATNLPLVMHGGSGVSSEDYRKAIVRGVRKINYYSYMAREGAIAARKLLADPDIVFYHDVSMAAEKAMQADLENAVRLFCNI